MTMSSFIRFLQAAWLIAILPRCLADPMIGACNMTHFIAGGQRCQRKMISNLKYKSNSICSVEYKLQTSCLTAHLSSCLAGVYAGFLPEVASLIRLLFYHCGDLKVDPAGMNQLLLNQIQCKSQVFTKTVQCWDAFRHRFNTEKSDPQLCRDYAVAKECVTQEAKSGCAIGQYINRDLFNPFCTYNMDPPLDTSVPTVMIGRCSSRKFAFSSYTCQRQMMANLVGSDGRNCREEYGILEACLASTMDTCLADTSLSMFQDQVRQLVQSLLYHCGSFIPDKSSMDSFLLNALNCNESIFHTALKCWDEFRLRLIVNNFDKQLCIDYAIAKRCVLRSVERGCAVGDLMEDDLYNPFCVDGIDPLSLPSTSAMTSNQFKLVCKNDFLHTKGIMCEYQFLKAIYSTRVTTNCRDQSQSFLSCLRTSFDLCVKPLSNSVLLEALALAVLQTLQGTQLLCDSPITAIAWDDFPPILQTVASCKNEYTDEVIICGKKFRSKFIPVPSPLCEEFENAKQCVDEARKSLCSFDAHSRAALMGNFNPFCDNRTEPLFTDDGGYLRLNLKLEILIFITLFFMNFT